MPSRAPTYAGALLLGALGCTGVPSRVAPLPPRPGLTHAVGPLMTGPSPVTTAVPSGLAVPVAAAPAPLVVPEHADAPVPIYAEDPSWGSSLAPVTIVAFMSYPCGSCRQSLDTLFGLQRTYGPERLRLVWKSMAPSWDDDGSVAAQAVFVLGGPAAFLRFSEQAFAHPEDLSEERLAAYAEHAGVDVERHRQARAHPRQREKVGEDRRLGVRLGVQGTPAFFVNGLMLDGAQPRTAFVKLIDQQLAEATAATARGVPASSLYPALATSNYRPPERRALVGADTTTAWQVPTGSSPWRGARAPLVTVVAFSDFQCEACAQVGPVLDELLRRYPSRLRLVMKSRPLAIHDRAEPAAQLAMEAFARAGNAGYWRAHEALFASGGALDDTDLARIARKVGLAPERTMRAVREHAHEERIEDDLALAGDLGASGTPHFFINGRRLVGSQPLSVFVEIVDEEIAAAERLLARGVPRARLYAHLQKTARPPPPPEQKSVPAPVATTPTRGPEAAPVTVQIFADFACSFCARLLPTLARLERAFPGKLRVAFRHKPLPHHAGALSAAMAAQEAFAQGGNDAFWRMHDLLFASQGQLDREHLLALGARLGLDGRELGRAIDTERHRAHVEADIAVAEQAGISGTPGTMINGYFVSGTQPYSDFRRRVERALREATAPPATAADAAR